MGFTRALRRKTSFTEPAFPSIAFQIGGSQFVFSRDPLIGFIRCLDPITRFWQVTHNRKLEITGTVAKRRARIPHPLAKAKLVRHGSSNSKRDIRAVITAVGVQHGDTEMRPKRCRNPRCAPADLTSGVTIHGPRPVAYSTDFVPAAHSFFSDKRLTGSGIS